MKNLTMIFPSKFIDLAINRGRYWELPQNVYVTDNEDIIISILDSAIEETLVIYWSEVDQIWFHYTNCFGIDSGGDYNTKLLLEEWYEDIT